jgi:IS1 family transposase
MVVERGSMRGAARAMGVDKDTICEWVRKASEHADTFSEFMLRDLHMTAVELDELWTTVKKKQEHIEDDDWDERDEIGDAMVWKAEELPSRLRVASVVGKRTDSEATELVTKVKERSDGSLPLFISDNLDAYPHALLNVYGEREEPKREKRPGRPRTKPIIKPPADLQYAQVVKHRDEHGRVTSIERRVVFGTEKGVKGKLKEAGCYTTISTAHVESDNLMSRQTSSRLVRDALSFSKEM